MSTILDQQDLIKKRLMSISGMAGMKGALLFALENGQLYQMKNGEPAKFVSSEMDVSAMLRTERGVLLYDGTDGVLAELKPSGEVTTVETGLPQAEHIALDGSSFYYYDEDAERIQRVSLK